MREFVVVPKWKLCTVFDETQRRTTSGVWKLKCPTDLIAKPLSDTDRQLVHKVWLILPSRWMWWLQVQVPRKKRYLEEPLMRNGDWRLLRQIVVVKLQRPIDRLEKNGWMKNCALCYARKSAPIFPEICLNLDGLQSVNCCSWQLNRKHNDQRTANLTGVEFSFVI